MLLFRIPWHHAWSGPGEVAVAAEHRKITKHAHLHVDQPYQFVPVAIETCTMDAYD